MATTSLSVSKGNTLAYRIDKVHSCRAAACGTGPPTIFDHGSRNVSCMSQSFISYLVLIPNLRGFVSKMVDQQKILPIRGQENVLITVSEADVIAVSQANIYGRVLCPMSTTCLTSVTLSVPF